MVCLKCGHTMSVDDTKNYKSNKELKDIDETEKSIDPKKHNNYTHRWLKCEYCGTTGQTSEYFLPKTIVFNDYEDFTQNMPLFKKQGETKKDANKQ